MKRFALILASLALGLALQAKVTLPSAMADGMVLQQQTKVNIWGKAAPKAKITVTASWAPKAKYTAQADADGKWLVKVQTPVAGGPYTLKISDGEPVVLKDVLVGEVWICSGQSNMSMKLRGNPGQAINGSLEEIMYAGRYRDRIRCFNMDTKGSTEICEDVPNGRWEVCTPETVPGFSAIGYYFAKHLTENLNAPVGIIVNAWGAADIEAFLRPDTDPALIRKGIENAKHEQQRPFVIHNSMVAPLASYTAKGFIWYQGEANALQPELYIRQQNELIAQWRKYWQNDKMPFYFAMIAHFDNSKNNGRDFLPAMFDAQLKLSHMDPYTGIIGTADIGEQYCIHPAAKDKVGFRFAHMALSKTYRHYGACNIPATGPEVQKVTFKDKVLMVEFNQTLRQVADGLLGFEVEYADGRVLPVKATDVGKPNMVRIWCEQPEQVKAVRYGQHNYIKCNLLNTYDLPAFPFRKEVEIQ